MTFDIRAGGLVEFEDGRLLQIPANPARVFFVAWPNGAVIESMVHDTSPGDEPTDLIELVIKPAEGRGDQKSYYMNRADADAVILCMLKAVKVCNEKNLDIGTSEIEWEILDD